MRYLAICLCALLLALPVRAQQIDVKPLVVPFAQFPPFLYLDRDGQRTGFIADLAEMIGSEIDVPIDYLDVANAQEWVAAQAAGQAQLIPGVLKLPPLAATNGFSSEVAADVLRPAVLASNEELIASGVLDGRRVGIVPPAIGSEEPILDQNIPVAFNSPQEAVIALLSGKVDAVLLPKPVVYGLAREAGFDGRIRFIGDPLRSSTRHVALHESRADLMPAINAAITRLEADGRLEALRQRYNITVPPPPPKVLIVGFSVFPPYKLLDENGEPTGFSVETLRNLAARAGLEIEFRQVTQEQWEAGPLAAGVDMLTLSNISDSKSERMDFTNPTVEARLSIFTRAGEAQDVTGLDDLVGLKVGGVAENLALRVAQGHGGLSIETFETPEALQKALLAQDVDAAVFTSENFLSLAVAEGVKDQIREVLPPFLITRAAPALRPGLAAIRDRLNGVITGFLVSEDHKNLQQKYFAEPVFWTQDRIFWSLLAAGAVVLLLVIGLGVQIMRVRARARAAAAMALVRDELDTIFNAATSGIVALDADGQIIRANNRARHFLGGLSDPAPFPWPAEISFIDAETLEPLDNSADPVKRALAGNTLRNETHLMRRLQVGDDQRYVRVESARPEQAESAINTVLVIDDISTEERNRQVVERQNRLDALGQLTGGIAHDFNNMLASLVYSIDLARRAKTKENLETQLEAAMGSLVRGRTLTSRLLAFARKQPGLASVRKTSDILDEFQTLVRPMLEAQIEITFTVDEPGLRQYCDPTQLETALMNLTLNARDAILRSGKGNRIDIRARPVRAPNKDLDKLQAGAETEIEPLDGGSFRYVEFSVMDNGPGMDDETLARCTDPFFTTKDSNSGTGLGLAMVYGFVRQSDGVLRIYSEEGVGTTVQMTLPRGSELGGREEPVEEEPAIKGDAQIILVVEDELPLLAGLAQVLEELDYEVISAKSGPEAMKLVDAGERFDLLLTDVVMPGAFGGFELARRVREKHPDAPVLYTSGYTGFSKQEMGEVQAPLLQKPALPHELASAIADALSSKVNAQS